VILPTTTLLLATTAMTILSSEDHALAMLVDESKSVSAASTILDSLCCVFNGETGLLVSSGFVWYVSNDNWYVATTASELSKNSKNLQVEFADGREFAATVAFSDIDTNIAFLRVKVDGAPPPKAARIGRSGNLKVGQDVLAAFKENSRRGGDIGNAVVRSGIVSGLNRTVPSVTGRPLRNCIQTTASFPKEGSGGVLVDSGGTVIGVLAPTYAGKSGVSAGSSNGIFFAIGVDSYVLISQKLTGGGR
jgi:S1-C subfamily serine protease